MPKDASSANGSGVPDTQRNPKTRNTRRSHRSPVAFYLSPPKNLRLPPSLGVEDIPSHPKQESNGGLLLCCGGPADLRPPPQFRLPPLLEALRLRVAARRAALPPRDRDPPA